MSTSDDSVTSPSEQPHAGWESCPAGVLTRTVRGLQARQHDRRRAKMVGVGGSVVVLLFLGAMIAQQFGQSSLESPNMTRITCATVQTLLPAYLAGKLEAAVMNQMDTHLDGCPHCRQRYQKAKDDTALPGQRISEPPPQLALNS